MTDEYTVDDWIELQYKIENLESEMDIEGDNEYDSDILKEIKKASDFIKETLRIRAKPIVTKSGMTGEYYYVNIYTMDRITGLITAYSKKPATEMEIRELYKEVKD